MYELLSTGRILQRHELRSIQCYYATLSDWDHEPLPGAVAGAAQLFRNNVELMDQALALGISGAIYMAASSFKDTFANYGRGTGLPDNVLGSGSDP